MKTIGGLFPNYSEGERAGQVTKISKKGLIFKSLEGDMNVGGTTTDSNGSAIPNVWHFSVSNDKFIEKIKDAASTGKRVTLVYSQYYVGPMRYDSP